MFSMHTAHLANVSKSVTKNATFPRTGGLPCLITQSCMSGTYGIPVPIIPCLCCTGEEKSQNDPIDTDCSMFYVNKNNPIWIEAGN